MKYLAHLENNLESKIVSIYEVKNGLNSTKPQLWENKEYYSLWYLTPMKAIVNTAKKAPHFSFKNGGGGNENSGSGESIEHQLAKKTIYDKKALTLRIGEIEDTLNFSDIIIEQQFENGLYKADLFAKIENTNKFDFPPNSYLIIEIHKTNKVSKTKQQFFRDKNFAAIEIELFDKIKYDNDLEKLQRQLSGYFDKLRYAKTLHDPYYIRHKQEREKREADRMENLRLQQINRSKTEQLNLEKSNIIIAKPKVQKNENEFNYQTVDTNKFEREAQNNKSNWITRILSWFKT
jgi:hypothetical protein